MNTSAFESSGIYVVLVEPGEYHSLRSRVNVSGIHYREKSNVRSNARISRVAPLATCYPQLNDQGYSVGRFTSSRENCSFSIINNENSDRRPLVLSARHCINKLHPDILEPGAISAIENATFRVAWRSGCYLPYSESTRWIGTGSTDNKHKITWNIGETETGSSGGPLIKTSDNKVVGGLSWGTEKDRYFKLSNAWSGSGAIKSYLSNIYDYTSINALIPTQITGPKVLCYDATTGNDVTVWSWSGTSSFTVSATNTCGTVSAFFHPNSSGFRMAVNNSTIYPNMARDYVRVSLSDAKDWERVASVRIIDSGTGQVPYSKEFTGANRLGQRDALEIDLKNIGKGKYILEIQYINSRDSHHLIID